MTTIEPKGGGRSAGYDAFEYISHSHTYISDNQPTAKFTYDLSPIQVRGFEVWLWVVVSGWCGVCLELEGFCWDYVCGGEGCVVAAKFTYDCHQYRCAVFECLVFGGGDGGTRKGWAGV
jgi:hypothetical protein